MDSPTSLFGQVHIHIKRCLFVCVFFVLFFFVAVVVVLSFIEIPVLNLMHTVETLIRYHIVWHLIGAFIVWQCPFCGMPGINRSTKGQDTEVYNQKLQSIRIKYPHQLYITHLVQ